MKNAFNLAFRVVSTLLGLIVVLMGVIWLAQGLGVAPGRLAQSFMENDRRWAAYGLIAIIVGVGQIVWSNTRQAKA